MSKGVRNMYSLKFGKGEATVDIPKENLLGVLRSREIPSSATEEGAVRKALANPIGSSRIDEKVKPGDRVCIVVCDLTRAWQHPSLYLPILVEEVKKGGVKDEDIFFLVATGTHRSHMPADLVVASACGYPKDINFYQTTKTLFNAQDATRPGGTVVILASCVEGYGNEETQMMLKKFKNSDEREVELRREFTIAKYVGYCAGAAAEQFDFHLVTDMEADLLEGTGIKISRTLDEALEKVYAVHGRSLKTWLMSQGVNTLPKLVS
jgi:nickel-dependent lactate racemase